MLNLKSILQYSSREQSIASLGPSMNGGYQHFGPRSDSGILLTPYKLASTLELR